MNVITVTRDYGAGGYEVAPRLAEQLGWEVLDRELLHQAAALERVSDEELERMDEKAVRLVDRFRLHPPHQRYLHGLTEVARRAAERGNVVLVGRGTGQLLADCPTALHLRLVAPLDLRARRMAQKEGWSQEQALARCTEQDRTRERFTRYFFGDAPLQSWSYHLTFHTGRVPLDDVVACVTALVRGDLSICNLQSAIGNRVLTLSRELGAGSSPFAQALADRLGLKVYERELLEQQAGRPEVLGRLMSDLAAAGNVLLVGRGGSRFLRDHLGAFHVRLVAASPFRVRRVMASRWVRDDVARRLIADSDSQRRRFYEACFGADWASPLEYHLTVNAARLGPAAADVVAFAAARHVK
jgi:cytidylate kinase